ncbi:MAG: M20/M25/M40 family metallo-hydrolase [Flavobacteriales bacterium]|nr:M20/M25/M40 family metallo-hydrolase [Flavobacteriales bacterium]
MSLRYSAFLTGLVLCSATRAQHPVIQSVLDAMRMDSMLHYVNELSGEVPTQINGSQQTITSRYKTNAGNVLAQDYLTQKLTQFGYTPVIQSFSTTGKNILVTKPGDGSTNEVVVLCAHYDAMPAGNLNAPAADDDGSGVCALLEAARILRDVDFVHPIVFALWDEEEQGKIGSAYYAAGMAANDALIKAVVNMDAIAYDGDGDTKARVHVRPIANSLAIADTVFAVLDHYAIGLDLLNTNPGATYSDHASFWNEGYGAVLIIEEFSTDANPHYHTPTDLVQYFDVPYYDKLARLSIGTLATLAIPVEGSVSVLENAGLWEPRMYAYPNPTVADAGLWLELPNARTVTIDLYDTMGKHLASIHKGMMPAGKNGFTLPLANLAPGGYVVRAQAAGKEAVSLRLVRLP